MEDFEFSQQFLYFWDRIERAYFFINAYEELARKGEEPDGRLMMFLLSNPLNDGGQWDMLINLVEKYGLVPKAVWPEAFTSGRSMRLRKIMNYKVCYIFIVCLLSQVDVHVKTHLLPSYKILIIWGYFHSKGSLEQAYYF